MKGLLASLFGKKDSLPSDADREELQQLQAVANETHKQLIAQGKAPGGQEDAQSWIAARENGYVNCLLTVLGEGPTDSVTITQGEGLPNLKAIAVGNADLERWVATLAFPYGELSSDAVLGILASSFNVQKGQRGRLKTILVKNDGSPLAVIFYAELVGRGLKVSIVRPH